MNRIAIFYEKLTEHYSQLVYATNKELGDIHQTFLHQYKPEIVNRILPNC